MNDFTLHEPSDLVVEKAEAGVACQQSKGDPRDFIRKRKRAYHRAIKRGDKSLAVLNFELDILIKKSIKDLCKRMFSFSCESFDEFYGLNSIVDENQHAKE